MLKGKSALITSSTFGIGKSIASALASSGCHVLINGFGDPDEIEAFRADMENEHGVRAIYSSAAMNRPQSIKAMIKYAEEEFGGIDILVNSAGMQHVAPVEELSTEKWDALIAINLSSAFHTIHSALPRMKEKGWGRIINIASAHGLVASPNKSAYVAAKHGLIGLTRTVALEVAQLDITCNAICPGFVHTPQMEKQIEEKAESSDIDPAVIKKSILAPHPNGKFVSLQEINSLTLLLAGENSASINGAAFAIDGGWTAR